MTTTPETSPVARLHTIGAVCERLRDEFPDISISKIRYLEDQGLLQPSRTRGGYRLFSEADVERLIMILRLQRDEFLPLRVIREELRAPTADRAKRRAAGLRGQEDEIDMAELCERAGISAEFARQLEDFSLLAPRVGGRRPALSRERSRHRARVRSDRPPRDRRATPTRLPNGSRSPVGAARAGRRSGASLSKRRAAGSGSRGPRERLPASHRSWLSCSSRVISRKWPSDDRADLTTFIRDVPDFPSEGILFKDVMPLIADPAAFRETIDRLAAWAGPQGARRDPRCRGAGVHLRGALAYALGCGFVTARKPGKLPWKTMEASYDLEYGTDALQVHVDAIEPGARVIVLDDVLATGGTARAKIELSSGSAAGRGALLLIELPFLHGRERIAGTDVHALIDYS